MTLEEKELLEKTYKLSEENNEILKGLRRSQKVVHAIRATYWILIIVLSFVGYWGAQTYLKSILGAFGDGSNVVNNPSLIDQYKELLQQ